MNRQSPFGCFTTFPPKVRRFVSKERSTSHKPRQILKPPPPGKVDG